MFFFDEFQNSLGCPNSYLISGILTSSNVNTATSPNEITFFGVDNIVTTHNFQIVVSSELSTYTVSGTLTTFCTASSIDASTFSASQNADVASGNEFFEIPPYTSAVTGCTTFTYEIFTNTGASSVPAGLSVDTVSNAPNIRVVAANGQLTSLYLFFIRVTEAGGAILWTSQCSLNIVCGITSQPVITQPTFELDQNIEIYVTANPVFFFLEFGNSVGCVNSYSVINFLEVVEYEASNSTWVARQSDEYRLRKMTHTFTIIVRSWFASMVSGPFTLNTYCGMNSAILSESSFESNQRV